MVVSGDVGAAAVEEINQLTSERNELLEELKD